MPFLGLHTVPITPMASPSVPILAIFCYILFLFSRLPSFGGTSFETCSAMCGDTSQIVRFPFSLMNSLAGSNCGLPGFGLRCKRLEQANSTETMLVFELPDSGEFLVRSINYTTQTISINDPGNCLPERFLRSFNVSGSPFQPIMELRYTFFNCSSSLPVSENVPITCLSSRNYTVLAASPDYEMDMKNISHCRNILSVLLPVQGPSLSYPLETKLDQDVVLTWDVPLCRDCEERGGTCGFKWSGSDRLVGCFNLSLKSDGLPRAAKYSIILVVGTPGLLCMIWLACFACRRIRTYSRRSRTSVEFSALAEPHPTLLTRGLDGPTIESYPKTQLGESKRLPKPGDSTCSICLCEYQPKETLMTIPECKHYFHLNCIDEWLRLNASCPLCRNSPGPSSLATSSSSLSSSTLSA